VLISGLFLIAGCATTAPRPPVSVCIPVVAYSPAVQAKAADELDKLPPGSVLAQMIVDYGAMRDAARACASR
jgi:hypothetical protein